MEIHAHIVTWNEERLIPFTLDYYSLICDKIFIWDNESTDSTQDICKIYPNVEFMTWASGGEINNKIQIEIKSYEYRKLSREADWVIICDCDEFLYHPNLLNKLQEYKDCGITLPHVVGHNMVSETFPDYDGSLITSQVKIGTKEPAMNMSKYIIFNPKLDMIYGPGCHGIKCQSSPDMVKFSPERELKLLHYKFLGKDYVKDRYKSYITRISEFNKSHGLSGHYKELPFKMMDKVLLEGYNVI
jgi:glycosyltransferase involved in cell wall biosynthesis